MPTFVGDKIIRRARELMPLHLKAIEMKRASPALYAVTIAEILGIPKRTVSRWLKKEGFINQKMPLIIEQFEARIAKRDKELFVCHEAIRRLEEENKVLKDLLDDHNLDVRLLSKLGATEAKKLIKRRC